METSGAFTDGGQAPLLRWAVGVVSDLVQACLAWRGDESVSRRRACVSHAVVVVRFQKGVVGLSLHHGPAAASAPTGR